MSIMKFRKKIAVGALALVMAGALVFIPRFVAAPAQAMAVSSEEDAPTITVAGAGAVNVEPDMVTVNLGVATEHRDPQQAMEENNEITERVLAAIRALGIHDEDIRTTNFSMHPVRDWSRSVAQITGYSVTNTVRVTVRDIDVVGTVLGAGVTAGATVSGGVQFSISDSSAAYNQALALAVQNARSKADAISAALGTSVDAVISVVESGGHHMPVFSDSFLSAPSSALSMDFSSAIVPIEAGELTVRANVQIVYSIR